MGDVTQILSAIERGDPRAANELLPLVYEELRNLAAHRLSQEKPGQTLQATALVHEAYLRLLGPAGTVESWNSRGHFFAAAAEAMRRILVDNSRRKKSQKRGGNFDRIEFEVPGQAEADPQIDLLALDDALRKFEEQHPDKAEVVKLRYFAGLSLEETAEMLGVSRATAQRRWAFARAWLFRHMNPT